MNGRYWQPATSPSSKAVGMSPRQLLAMVRTARAVLGVIGGLVALPLGVRPYHGLVTQLARQVGNRPPPFAFQVLHPTTLYPLGVMGLAVALAGAMFPAVEPPAAGPPRSWDRGEAAWVLFQRA